MLTVIPPNAITWFNKKEFPPALFQTATYRVLPLSVNFGNIFVHEKAGDAQKPGESNPPTGILGTLPVSYYETPPDSNGIGGIAHGTASAWQDVDTGNNQLTLDFQGGPFPSISPVDG